MKHDKSIHRPGSGQDPLKAILARVVVDSPLSRVGSRYAILDRPHIERWGRGAFLVTLCALAALLRRSHRKTLGLTAPELADSTGLGVDTVRRHLRAFEAEGLASLNADGVWRPTNALRRGKGHFAKVDTHNLPNTLAAVGWSGFRLLCWDRMYTTREGKLTVQYQRLAEVMGLSRATVWRGYSALRAAGIHCGARLCKAARKTATWVGGRLQRPKTPTGLQSKKESRKGWIGGLSTAIPRIGLTPQEEAASRRRQLAQVAAILAADAIA